MTTGTVTHLDPQSRLPEAELAALLQRHASGDWGESRYTDDNEAALRTGQPILSVFRTAAGRQLMLITWTHPARTSVWLQTGIPYPEEVLVDLVCRHVGTGRRADLPPSAHGALYAVPLIGQQAPDTGGIEAVTRLLETNAFPSDPIGVQAAGLFAIAAHQLGATQEQRQRLTATLRAIASACLNEPPSSIRSQLIAGFRFVAQQLDDNVLAAMMPVDGLGTPVAANELLAAVMVLPRLSREQILELPERYDRETMAPIAQAIEADATFAPSLPRNQICWCGSGKKFKRCHGSGTIPTAGPMPSPRTLSVIDVQTRPLRDLATMRLDQLGDQQLASAIDRLVKYRAWEVAERGLAAFDKREHIPQETRDHIRDILVAEAVRGQRWDLATKHAQELRSARFGQFKADLAVALPIIERGPQSIDHLLVFAEAAVRDPQKARGRVGVILQTMPALGVLLLRADVATDLDSADHFLPALGQARERARPSEE